MTDSKHYRTIVMSDIHLGSKWSKAKEANRFLKYHTCDTLILCGDVIDGWELLRGRREKWKRRHTNFIRRLLDIQHDTPSSFRPRYASMTSGSFLICSGVPLAMILP